MTKLDFKAGSVSLLVAEGWKVPCHLLTMLINFFSSLLLPRLDKLECLPLQSSFSLV